MKKLHMHANIYWFGLEDWFPTLEVLIEYAINETFQYKSLCSLSVSGYILEVD